MIPCDLNTVIGDLQLAGFMEVIDKRNLALKKAGATSFFSEPRRVTSNVNVPYATTDFSAAIGTAHAKDFTLAVTADARDQNEVYRQKPSEGGLLATKSNTAEVIRGYYGVGAVFRRKAQTIPNRLDTLEDLDSSVLKLTKDTTGGFPELRAVGAQFLDRGVNLQPGTDAAGSPTTGILDGTTYRRCCPIKPGIIVGKNEQLVGELLHRRNVAWGAAFELDLYFICLESRLAVNNG